MSRNIQQKPDPLPTEEIPVLKRLVNERHIKIPALFRGAFAHDCPPPNGFNLNQAYRLLNSESLSNIYPVQSRWMREAIEAHQRPPENITPHDFMNSVPWLYDLAGPNNTAANLTVGGLKVGQTMPLKELEYYLSSNPKAANRARNLILSPGETYRHLHDQNHVLLDSSEAFLLIIIKRDNEWRMLAVVNNAMHESMRQARPYNLKRTTDKTFIRKARNQYMRDIPQWHYKQDAKHIIAECDNRKVVMVFKAFSGTSFSAAAVPLNFGETLRRTFFRHIRNFVRQIPITEMYRDSTVMKRVEKNENFFEIMKSDGGQVPKFEPAFMLIPYYLLQYIRFDKGGLIRDIRDTEPLRFEFNALADLEFHRADLRINFNEKSLDKSAQDAWILFKSLHRYRYDKHMPLETCAINRRDFISENSSNAHNMGAHAQALKVPAKMSYTLHPDGSISDVGIQFETNEHMSALIALSQNAHVKIGSQIFHFAATPTPGL